MATTKATSYVQVHVSGLEPDCEDATVDAALRRLIAAGPRLESPSAPGAGTLEVQTGIEEPGAAATGVAPSEVRSDADTGLEAKPQETESLTEAAAEADANTDVELAAIMQELAVQEAFVNCVVVRNKDTSECKGYCFLTFATPEQAEAAIAVLNAGGGASVPGGPQLYAQLSKPKDRFAKAKDPNEALNDLKIRRTRYPAVSKKAQYGHFSHHRQNKADRSDIDGTLGGHAQRNSAGRITGVTGTRGGKPVVSDEKRCKSNTDLSFSAYAS